MNIEIDRFYLSMLRYARIFIIAMSVVVVIASAFAGSMVPALLGIVISLSFLAIAHHGEIVFVKRQQITWRNICWEFGVVAPSILITSYVMINTVLGMEGSKLNPLKYIDFAAKPPSWSIGLLLLLFFAGFFYRYYKQKQKD